MYRYIKSSVDSDSATTKALSALLASSDALNAKISELFDSLGSIKSAISRHDSEDRAYSEEPDMLAYEFVDDINNLSNEIDGACASADNILDMYNE